MRILKNGKCECEIFYVEDRENNSFIESKDIPISVENLDKGVSSSKSVFLSLLYTLILFSP